jgi:tetratricopeptide (TPR) repeat protein
MRLLKQLSASPRPLASCALLALLLVAGSVRADDRAAVVEMKAEQLAAENRCVEALRAIDEARQAGPVDAKLLLIRGECEIRLERYEAALASLEEARSADPSLADVDLYLGVARYHTGDFDGADEALRAARGKTGEEAQLELYTGLLLLRKEEARDAALAFERARRADPSAVEPVASYYAALAWQREEDRRRAREALERVQELDPNGPWGAEAGRALSAARPASRVWASLTGGLEYDSNVVLEGNSAAFNISDEDDYRGVWAGEGGVELFRTERWSGGILGAYTGSAHFQKSRFDIQYPSGSVWLDREFGDATRARLRYDIGYAWVGYTRHGLDPFLFTQQATAALRHDWGSAGATEVRGRLLWEDYRFPLFQCGGSFSGACTDRDGIGGGGGIAHAIPLGFRESVLRGGYSFLRFSADGTEWDSDRHRFTLGAQLGLPAELRLDLEGGYTLQPFQHVSFFDAGGNHREDEIWTARARLARAIGRHLELSAQYLYTNDDSNVPAYDYDRHIVGAYLTLYLR